MSSVNGVGTGGVYQAYNSNVNAAGKENKASQTLNEEATIEDIVDIGSGSQSSSGKIYTRDTAKVNYLNSVTDSNLKMVQDLVRKLITKQAGAAEDVLNGLKNTGELEIDDETRAQAAELISEDGPLGVKAVSQNILDFAKAISGGDPSMIEDLREATKQGFEEVAKMFGGWDNLPDITKETFEATMKGFDEWAEEAGVVVGG